MYLGHSFLAFAAVAVAGYRRDVEPGRVLLAAVLAAAFGILPDLDMWRTVLVFLLEGPEGVFPTEEHVFVHSWVVHRTLTHSVVTGACVVVATGLFATARARETVPQRAAASGLLAAVTVGLLAFSLRSADALGFVTTGLFVAAAVAVAHVGVERGATPLQVTAAAAAGILTHPLGDLWMGRPPAFLYPLSGEPPIGIVRFSTDPVVHFLVALGVEVGLLAACVLAVATLTGRRFRAYLSPVAAVGLLYAAALAVVPAPTFAEAYQFVTGLLALSLAVAVAVATFDRPTGRRRLAARALVSGVAAFALALASFGVAYAMLG